MQTKTLLFIRAIIRCSRMYEQVSSYRKCIVQQSLEYSIRCIVVAVDIAVDVIIVKEYKSFVNPVVAYVVGIL